VSPCHRDVEAVAGGFSRGVVEAGGFGASTRWLTPPQPVQPWTPEVRTTQALAADGLGAATLALNVSVS
jgi:hypothetical protein